MKMCTLQARRNNIGNGREGRTENAPGKEDSVPEPEPSAVRGLSSSPLMPEPLSEAACSNDGGG